MLGDIHHDQTPKEEAAMTSETLAYLEACHLLFERGFLSHDRIHSLDLSIVITCIMCNTVLVQISRDLIFAVFEDINKPKKFNSPTFISAHMIILRIQGLSKVNPEKG